MTEIKHPAREICLRFEGVSFSYGPVKVLEKANFHIHRGEFVALLGPNGSGKTTVLKLLLGLEKAREGSIEILGHSFKPGRRLFRARSGAPDRVGYVPQSAALDRAFPITVREVVKMGRLKPLSRRFSGEDRAAVEEALEQVEIVDLAEKSYSALSGGQKRRVLAARALASRPEILILDEPTANMDTGARRGFSASWGSSRLGERRGEPPSSSLPMTGILCPLW